MTNPSRPPILGWTSSSPTVNLNEDTLVHQAGLLVDRGLAEAGYRYVVIDARWQAGMGADGRATPDVTRFPSIEKLPARLGSLGLKAGITIRAGSSKGKNPADGLALTCRRACGDWGFTFVSIAGSPEAGPLEEALRSVRESRDDAVIELGAGVSAPPRTLGLADHRVLFDRLEPDYFDLTRNRCDTVIGTDETNADASLSVTRQRARESASGRYFSIGPLPLGRGMNPWQEQAAFSMYCVLTSPVLVAADLAVLSAETLTTLRNPDALAISQDPLCDKGVAAHYYDPWHCLYRRHLADGTLAVLMLNRCHNGSVFSLRPDRDLGASPLAPFSLRDIWENCSAGTWWRELSTWVETSDAGTAPCCRMFRVRRGREG